MCIPQIYFDEYSELPDSKRNKMDHKYDLLFLQTCNYDVWSGKEESPDTTKTVEKSTDLPPMLPMEGNEKVKEEKLLKY